MRLMILAAGMSSRMKQEIPLTEGIADSLIAQSNVLPKGMIGLGENGRPFLEYLLFNASEAGFKEVMLVLNPQDGVTQEHFQAKTQAQLWGLSLLYARQHIPPNRQKPAGTADAICQALHQHSAWQTGDFVVCNSDNLYSVPTMRLLLADTHVCSLPSYDRNALGLPEDRLKTYALLRTNSEGFLQDMVEKPSDEEEAEIRKISGGRLGLSANIFKIRAEVALTYFENEAFHPIRNEKELPNVIRRIAHSIPQSVFCMPVAEAMPDLTSKADILEVQAFLQKHYPSL